MLPEQQQQQDADRATSCQDCSCSGAAEPQAGAQPRRFSGNRSAAASGGGAGIVVRKGGSTAAGAPPRVIRQQVPDDILHNEALNAAIAVLPANYNFEVCVCA